MAYINDFSVRITGGNELNTDNGFYVELNHNQTYTIHLRNNRPTKCDAKVEINGDEIGIFRINSYSSAEIKSPPGQKGALTYVELGSNEAEQTGLSRNNPNSGLIKVTFTPEKVCRPILKSHPIFDNYVDYSGSRGVFTHKGIVGNSSYSSVQCNAAPDATFGATRGVSSSSHNAGGTILSGDQTQQYQSVGSIEYDLEQQTEINIRLVSRKTPEIRPLQPIRSTLVPPLI